MAEREIGVSQKEVSGMMMEREALEGDVRVFNSLAKVFGTVCTYSAVPRPYSRVRLGHIG